jgi:hypothetical protein
VRLGAIVGALVVLAVLTAGAAGAADASSTTGDTFSITGDVDGVYPGFVGTLAARVTNTLDVSIQVRQVSGVAIDSSGGCDPAMLSITTAKTSLRLAPGETGQVPLAVRMRADADDRCQGASFTVRFDGTSLAQDRPPRALAFTGTEVSGLLAAAAVLLAAGLVVVRRTRTEQSP